MVHLGDRVGSTTRLVAPEQHTAATAASWELGRELSGEVKRAGRSWPAARQFGLTERVEAWVDLSHRGSR